MYASPLIPGHLQDIWLISLLHLATLLENEVVMDALRCCGCFSGCCQRKAGRQQQHGSLRSVLRATGGHHGTVKTSIFLLVSELCIGSRACSVHSQHLVSTSTLSLNLQVACEDCPAEVHTKCLEQLKSGTEGKIAGMWAWCSASACLRTCPLFPLQSISHLTQCYCR